MFGPISCGVGLSLFFWSDHLYVMVIALILTGTGVAFVDSPSMPLMSSIAVWKRFPQIGCIYALQDVCVCSGFALGPLLATVLEHALQPHGFNKTGLVVGGILLAYTPILLHLRHVPSPSELDDLKSISYGSTVDHETLITPASL